MTLKNCRRTVAGLLVVSILFFLAAAGLAVQEKQYFLAGVYGFVAVWNTGVLAYSLRRTRCKHSREVLVGFCGDEKVLHRAFSYPAENILETTEVVTETVKVRCLECRNTRLVKAQKTCREVEEI